MGVFKMKKPLLMILFTFLYNALMAQSTQVSDQKINRLIKELSDRSPVMRANAAKSLGRYGKAAAPAIPTLIKLLRDDTGLDVIEQDMYTLTEKVVGKTSVSYCAGDALASIGEPSVEPLLRRVPLYFEVEKYTDEAMIGKIQRILRDIGEPAVVPLLEYLHSPDEKFRYFALYPLCGIKDSRTVNPLINMLNDKSSGWRGDVAQALGNFSSDPRTTKPLLAVLENDSITYVRRHAIWGLDSKKDLIVVNTFIDILLDEDDNLRRAAAEALSKIKNPLAIEPFIKTFKKAEDWRLRRECLRGLMNWRNKQEIIDVFLIALQDRHAEVRKSGVGALGGIWEPTNFTEKAIICVAQGDWDECVDIGSEAVKPLFVALRDANSETKIGAAKALGEIKDTSAVNPLIEVLHNKDDNVRRHVALSLGWIKDPRAAEPLITLLHDESRWVRETAVTALGNIGPGALDSLIPASEDPDLIVRSGAVTAIGMIRHQRSFDALKSAINDEESEIRKKAVEGLVNQMDDPRWYDTIINILFDENVEGDYYIVKALGEHRDPRAVEPLLSVLKKHDNTNVRRGAIISLGLIGDVRAVKPLIKFLKRGNLKTSAATALGKIDNPDAVDALVSAVRKKFVHAAFALARLKDTRAVPVLILVLGRTYPESWRKAAVNMLGELKDPRAVPALAEMLDGYEVEDYCAVVTQALGKIGAPAAEALIARMKHKKPMVRVSVVKALGEIDDPIVIPPLLEALKNEEVRATAVKALGEKKDPIVVPTLIDMLQDKRFSVRQAASHELGKMKDPRAIQPLIQAFKDEDYRIRSYAAKALAGMGEEAMEPLINCLKDPKFRTRAYAVRTLGMIEDSSTVDLFLSALKDEAVPVRLNAIEALEKYENEYRVLTALEEVALHDTNEDVRRSAVRKVTNREILADIAEYDPSELIRKMAQFGMLEQDSLYQVIQTELNLTLRKEALHRITDDPILAEISLNEKDAAISWPAVRKIRDQFYLMEVLNKSSDQNVLIEVIEKITDQSVLVDIARHGWKGFSSGRIRWNAIRRLSDISALEDIAMHDPDDAIRRKAEKRLEELR